MKHDFSKSPNASKLNSSLRYSFSVPLPCYAQTPSHTSTEIILYGFSAILSPWCFSLGCLVSTLELICAVAAVLHFDRIGRRCSYCFTNKTKAKTCSKCHLIAYCSRACQCADWPMHAHECKHLAAAIDAYGAWAESNARSASEQVGVKNLVR